MKGKQNAYSLQQNKKFVLDKGYSLNDDLSVSKTVRLYPETLEVIEGYRGKNFTEKLRNLVHDFARQNQEFVRQKEGEKGCGDMNRTRF